MMLGRWLFDWRVGPPWWRAFAYWWFRNVWLMWIASGEECAGVALAIRELEWMREVNR